MTLYRYPDFLPGLLTSQAEGKLATMALLLLLLNQGWIHCWQTCSESRVKKVVYCQHDPGPRAYQKTNVSYILKGTRSASAASGLKHQNRGPKSMSFVFTQPHSLPVLLVVTACCLWVGTRPVTPLYPQLALSRISPFRGSSPRIKKRVTSLYK